MMPKGDIARLKADPEDGTVPVARLLLDALVLCRLTALELRAVLYLIRQTYGWTDKEGRRYKERTISYDDWASHLGMDIGNPGNINRMLRSLTDKHILIRTPLTSGRGGFTYRINTRISEWDDKCINKPALASLVAPRDGYQNGQLLSEQTDVKTDIQYSPLTRVGPTGSDQSQKNAPLSTRTTLVRTDRGLGGVRGGLNQLLNQLLKKEKGTISPV
jgi:hypothetical protein